MTEAYGIVTPRRAFVVIQKGKKYEFVWWLFKYNGPFCRATTKALISEEADVLVVMEKGKIEEVDYTPQYATQTAKALPPWTSTRYVYFFKSAAPKEIWDCKEKRLLEEEECGEITTAIDSEIILFLYRFAGRRLWGQTFGVKDMKYDW
jgi:hypothetical protein